MAENHEVIYLGQIQGKEGRYGLVHETKGFEHFNFHLNYDNLSGYLEGAFAMHPWQMEIANGMPLQIRRSSFPGIELSKIDDTTLEKLLEDSGIKNKLGFHIKCY